MHLPYSDTQLLICFHAGVSLNIHSFIPYNRKYNVLSVSLNKTLPSFLINIKESFICTIPQTGQYVPQY